MSPTATLSPECRLVFQSAHPAFGPEAATLAGAVQDWPRVVVLAEREFATAGVWRALRASDGAVPAEVSDHLRKRTMVSDLRMQHLASRLQQTTRVLSDRGVPFLLLKGAALGAMTDPTFRARPMSDLDLLVRREDTARAARAIVDSGWPQSADPVVHELLQAQHHLPPFLDQQMPEMRLELHTAILPTDHPFTFGEEEMWRDARPAPEPFAGASLPSPEHLLLHACVHFAWQHAMQFGAWRTFRMVGAVGSGTEFDWDRFAATARDARAATSCYWTLRLATRLSGVPVPESVLDRLAPPTPRWFRDSIERHFVSALAPGEGPSSPSIQLSRLLWRAALRPKWSGHRVFVRWDPEHKWERARGTMVAETRMGWFRRHLGNSRDWWRFLVGTLLGMPSQWRGDPDQANPGRESS